MDILCRFCREPWDNDTIHEEVAERLAQEVSTSRRVNGEHPATKPDGHTYTSVAAEFRRFGCGAFVAFTGTGFQHSDPDGNLILMRCPHGGQVEDSVVTAVYDSMGDDMDGAASMLDDAEALGLL